MGKKTLASFIDRLRSDVELQTAFTEFASEHGFTLDADELGDADLDSVAGGIDTVPLPEHPRPYHAVKKKIATKKKSIRRKKAAKKKSIRTH